MPQVETRRVDGSRAAFCAGSGTIVEISEISGSELFCAGDIAARAFGSALCTCDEVSLAGDLRTDAGDSSGGGFAADSQGGGAVGVNLAYRVAGTSDIGGSLNSAAPEGISMTAGDNQIRGDLKLTARFSLTGRANVARDAWIGGGLFGTADLTVGRDLLISGAGIVPPSVSVGGEVRELFEAIPNPCACGQDGVDIDRFIDRAAESNENESEGLNPDQLAAFSGSERIELPCGRYYLRGVRGSGSLTLVARERTAIFVEGDFDVSGGVTVDAGSTGQVDIFVRNRFKVGGQANFGDVGRPAAVRVYVAGRDALEIGNRFVGNVYAPQAELSFGTMFESFGAIFVRTFTGAGQASIHYDRAIQRGSSSCELPPPPNCSVCEGCSGESACVDDQCVACRDDADCCEPLICDQGSCRTLLL